MEQQSEFTVPFDVIELPSGGILYPNRKGTIKVEFLTAMDENILTSPNLLQSGKFLDVLMERKVKEEGFSYKDLLTGDRDAIMIFLRATGYGHMYPVMAIDENGDEFKAEVDLNSLKQKPVGDTPDENSEFDFMLPMSKKNVKFRLLTVKDENDISQRAETYAKKLNRPFSDTLTYRLTTQVMEVGGNREKAYIQRFIETMPIGDSNTLRKRISDIEPGLDMKVEVQTPGGGSVTTFLTIGVEFFWPNLGV